MASASYVTGSHAIKAGMTTSWGTNSRTFTSNAEINTLVFAPGAHRLRPSAVVDNTPADAAPEGEQRPRHFAQDTWTLNRLTLNYGGALRSLQRRSAGRSRRRPATWIAGAATSPAIKNVPNWNDWSVRLAGAYDLFGNGKTALKANAGKYVAVAGRGLRGQTSTG